MNGKLTSIITMVYYFDPLLVSYPPLSYPFGGERGEISSLVSEEEGERGGFQRRVLVSLPTALVTVHV